MATSTVRQLKPKTCVTILAHFTCGCKDRFEDRDAKCPDCHCLTEQSGLRALCVPALIPCPVSFACDGCELLTTQDGRSERRNTDFTASPPAVPLLPMLPPPLPSSRPDEHLSRCRTFRSFYTCGCSCESHFYDPGCYVCRDIRRATKKSANCFPWPIITLIGTRCNMCLLTLGPEEPMQKPILIVPAASKIGYNVQGVEGLRKRRVRSEEEV